MASPKTWFVCGSCGYKTAKWLGKCPECGEWNAFVEEIVRSPAPSGTRPALHPSPHASAKPVSLPEVRSRDSDRLPTGIPEFDRCAGGIVPGQSLLVSGEPGIGKSTLLLQAAGSIAKTRKVYYFNGEESDSQVKLRADRLGVSAPGLFLCAASELDTVLDWISRDNPDVVFLDSLQTLYSDNFDSPAGSVVQVRECAYELVGACKARNVPLFLVSHITKTGNIAGPKVVEHIVDSVFYLESDQKGLHRLLRSLKNRFFSTDEVGLFRMGERGLESVEGFGEDARDVHEGEVSGVTFYPHLEGNRVFPTEVQALCAPSQFNYPRRTADGLDANRLVMLIAVMEKRLKCSLFPLDVYANITSGWNISDPALDLPAAIAVYSSFKDKTVPPDTALFGEVGLAGEVRAVAGAERRLAGLAKAGFKQVVLPFRNAKDIPPNGLKLLPVKSLEEAIGVLF